MQAHSCGERRTAQPLMNHSKGGGLPDYVTQNRSIENTDIFSGTSSGCRRRQRIRQLAALIRAPNCNESWEDQISSDAVG